MNVNWQRLLAPSCWLATLWIWPGSVLHSNQVSNTEPRIVRTRLVAVHEHCHLYDVSSDGDRILLSFTRTPIQLFTIPLDGSSPTKAKNPNGDQLRLVQLSTGKEIHRTHINGWAWGGWLIPGQDAGLVEWRHESGFRSGTWDTREPAVTPIASGENTTAAAFLVPISAEVAVGPRRGAIVKVRLPTLETEAAVPALPGIEDPQIGGLVVSRNRDAIAYVVEARGLSAIVLRTAPDLKVKREIKAPPDYSFSMIPNAVTFTPDGRMLVADAYLTQTGPVHQSTAVDEVLIYNAETGDLVRRFNIDARHKIAVSPDGRLLVAGRKKKERGRSGRVQAVAGIYSFETGHELGTVEHPTVTEPRKNPFIADFFKIAFTPDGRYLITSTQETRVWQVEIE